MLGSRRRFLMAVSTALAVRVLQRGWSAEQVWAANDCAPDPTRIAKALGGLTRKLTRANVRLAKVQAAVPSEPPIAPEVVAALDAVTAQANVLAVVPQQIRNAGGTCTPGAG